MLALLADENFHGPVVSGLRQKYPEVDVVRAQDVGLQSAPDELILQWAADRQRVVLSHDQRTMPLFAYARVERGLAMSGVVIVEVMSVGKVIEEIALLGIVGVAADMENHVRYIRA
jgi:predicted nuclease of predicted toxin-antitoxin system